MLKTFKAGERVTGGFYFNGHDWTMRVVPREGEVLPGDEAARYYAFPTVMMVIAAPLLSFAFVLFLPFIGIALMVKALVDKTAVVLHRAKTATPGADIRVHVTK